MNNEPITNNHFVSRGGIKLQAALDKFFIDVKDKVVLDVGSSTGGFVDCLLQNGAKKVYSVDTAYGQLDWKLRNDPRVVVMERTNILYLLRLGNTSDGGRPSLRGHDSSEVEKVDLITIDAGWTKLELVLPVVKQFLKPGRQIIALLKPHYEADKTILKKGVVPQDLVDQVKERVMNKIQDLGFKIQESMESPILGSNGKGNKEFLLLITA